MQSIEALLEKFGPMLSSKLAKRLGNIEPAAARKRIQRSSVHRAAVSFPHNDRFLYLQSQFGTEKYFERLAAAMAESRSIFGVALSSIAARGGIVPFSHFATVSGSPERLKKHLSTESVLVALEKLQVLRRLPSGAGDLLVLRGHSIASVMSRLRARMVVEEILIGHLAEWLRKTGLGSWGQVATRGGKKPPKFGQFYWDITVPSYIGPFKGFVGNKVKPGFIVADVILGSTIDQLQAEYFIRKCNISRQQKGLRPFLAILLATGFSKEAFNLGRKHGLLFVTPQTLFGQDVARVLSELLSTLTNAAAAAAKRPELVEELFKKLSAIEGAAGNLRGPLFELIVGHCVHAHEAGSIDIGRLATDSKTGDMAEIDVLLVKGQIEVRAYECRGKLSNNTINEAEAKKWLEEKVPIIRSWLLARFPNSAQTFELWTTGKFSAGAAAYLVERAKKTNKYRIAWKDGTGVLAYVAKTKATSLMRTLKEHYFRHPLAK